RQGTRVVDAIDERAQSNSGGRRGGDGEYAGDIGQAGDHDGINGGVAHCRMDLDRIEPDGNSAHRDFARELGTVLTRVSRSRGPGTYFLSFLSGISSPYCRVSFSR